MSDSSGFSLSVLDPRDLANFYGCDVAALMAGRPVAIDAKYLHQYEKRRKTMIGITRGDWFKEIMGSLLDVSGIGGLRFLSAQSHTCSYLEVEQHEFNGRISETKMLHEYTVINSETSNVLNAHSKLVTWCHANQDKTTKVLFDWGIEDIAASMENAFFTLHPNSEIVTDDEGRSTDFFFCVLRTVGELLRYAKHQGSWVVYDNMQAIHET